MEDIISEFFKTMNRVHTCRPKFQKHGDLSNVEFCILLEIAILLEERNCTPTVRDMMEQMDMSMSAVSKKLSILEKKGLISRNNSLKDRRQVCIALTEKGKEIIEMEHNKKSRWIGQIIGRVGVDETRQMLHLMNHMFDVIQEFDENDETDRAF